MTPSFTIVLPTIGRPTLETTLDSIASQNLGPNDRVMMISDGYHPRVDEVHRNYSNKLPIDLCVVDGPNNDWGHTPRNLMMPHVKTTHIHHMDDDDIYSSSSSLGIMRSHVEERPNVPHIYRVRFADDGKIIWATEGQISFGNVTTISFVHPHLKGQYAYWPPRVGGDFEFWRDTQEHYPPNSLVWHQEILLTARPHLAPR
jgi:hypothetical protein